MVLDSFSLEHQARLLDSVGYAVIATDASGTIRFWNHAAEELYGWASSEVIGRDIISVTPGPASEATAQEIMDSLLRGASWTGEFPVRRKDGATFLAEVTDTPVFDGQNTLIGVVGVSVDITRRRRAEERARFLAEAAGMLAAPLDPAEILSRLSRLPVPGFADVSIIYRFSDDGLIHRVASAHADASRQHYLDELERLYPVTQDSPTVVGHALRTREAVLVRDFDTLSLYAPDERYRAIARALDIRSLIVVPLAARDRLQGALVLAMASVDGGGTGRRFEDDDLHVAEWLGSLGALALDNVALLRDAERARALAEEANRAKSTFLASMSHELRTPLNAIAGYAELIEMGLRGPVTDAQRVDLARIRHSQQHLTGLIDNVLNFVRVEAGHLQFHIEATPLGAVLQRVEELVMPQLQRKGLRFSRSCDNEAVAVQADVEKLRQILLNLLGNAIKFTPAGGEISVWVRESADAVDVTVADSGIGIAPEMLEAVFEPFVRVGESSAPAEGVGLGLAISRDFARRMGGEIRVTSEPGKGSAFTLRLRKA